MGNSVRIIRQSDDGSEVPITFAEWTAYIKSDPELRHPEPGNLNYSETLVLLPSDSADPDDWEWLSWVSGSIYSDYPQQPMLKKMGQIARHLKAVLMGDEGGIWEIDEDGRVRIASLETTAGIRQEPAKKQAVAVPGIIWPFFNYDSATDPRKIIIWLLAWRPEIDVGLAERCLADEFQIPIQEASAALRACQFGRPIGMPAPEDYEEACLLCERLEQIGIVVKGCGVFSPASHLLTDGQSFSSTQ